MDNSKSTLYNITSVGANYLTVEQEHKLIVEYQSTKDKKILETLIRCNIRFAIKYAMQYIKHLPYNVEYDDIVACSYIALIDAINAFNPKNYKNKLITYASFHIKKKINEFCAEMALLSESRATSAVRVRFNRFMEQEKQKEDNDINIDELIERFINENPVSKETMIYIVRNHEPLSLDRIMFDEEDDSVTFADVLRSEDTNPEEKAIENNIKELIHACLSFLTEQEQQVIKLRYGLDDGICRTLAECSQLLGITKQRCAQIGKNALAKLRSRLVKYIV
jgi:RNA polymerase sigma factor (sigma-70 family)